MNTTTPTPEPLENLIDYANRETLQGYDDGRLWFLLKDAELRLAQVAQAAIAQPEHFLGWLAQGKIRFASSIHLLPGGDFYCLYFRDAYFLQPFEALPPEQNSSAAASRD